MKNFNITVNTATTHRTKPSNPSSESINTKSLMTVSLLELAETVLQPNGRTFSPATFIDNKRKNDQWLSQQVFCLDFDNGLTPEEALTTLAQYDITPNLIYTSFSDTPELRKFRLILVLEEVITNPDTAKWIIINLMNLFGQKADKACKDLSRMFYGSGSETPYFFNECYINNQKLFDVLNTVQIAADNGKTRNCIEPTASNFVSTLESPILDIEDSTLKTKMQGIYNNGEMIEKFDFEKAADNVRIFKDFISGKWLTHTELFGISTSMRWVISGLKLMRDTMNKFNKEGKTFYTANNFSILTYVAKMTYTPSNLNSFSPYEEDAEYTNIISAARNVQGSVNQYMKYPEISVDDANNKLIEKLDEILTERPKNKLFLVTVPTGLGKTELLTNLGGLSATIAFPTHKLKNEVAERFNKKGTGVKVTPNIPAFSDSIMVKINKLADLNLNTDINSLIKEIAKDTKEDVLVRTSFFQAHTRKPKYCAEDVELAKQYLKDSLDCYNDTSNIILTTHTKATYINFSSDLMIFDEDPMQQILNINSLDAVELKQLLQCLPKEETTLTSAISKLYTLMVDITPTTTYQEMPLIQVFAEKRDLIRNVILNPDNKFLKSNLMAFLDATHYIINGDNTINFIVKNEIQGIKDKTVIIMSATASETVYKSLAKAAGFDFELVDLGKVKMAGKIIQDTRYSLSKTSLINNLDYMVEKVGDLPVITFADLKEHFKNPVMNMHFGNCAGYDDLKGKDIAVVGTFNRPLFVYVLTALALKVKVELKSMLPTMKTVKYNGYSFQLNTWENNFITDIQMDLINSELVQATGRARTLREDCTVYLYSGFPLRESTSVIRSSKKANKK